MKKKNFRNDPYYKSLSLFLIGTIGTLLLVYVTFGLVMTAIKAKKLVDNAGYREVVSNQNVVKKQFEEVPGDNLVAKDVDVVVKEIHGKVISVQGELVVIETKVYGDEVKNVKLKLEDVDDSKVIKYLVDNTEEEMRVGDLEEGMYVGVQLPVEMLYSEVENDLIYVDRLIVNDNYKEGEEE